MKRVREMWRGISDVAMDFRSLELKILWNSLIRESGWVDSRRDIGWGAERRVVGVKWERRRIVSARDGRQICWGKNLIKLCKN